MCRYCRFREVMRVLFLSQTHLFDEFVYDVSPDHFLVKCALLTPLLSCVLLYDAQLLFLTRLIHAHEAWIELIRLLMSNCWFLPHFGQLNICLAHHQIHFIGSA